MANDDERPPGLTLAQFFDPLAGVRCWKTVFGHGTYLHIHFGSPIIDFSDVRKKAVSDEAGTTFETPGRYTSVSGSWHMFIEWRHWTLAVEDRLVANSLSSPNPKIANALRALVEGQSIASAEILPAKGDIVFRFDLGGVLTLHQDAQVPDDSWSMSQPDGSWLEVRSNGMATVWPDGTHTSDDEAIWLPIR